ncbi:MAG: short-chain dehydrogenase/reductase [Bryobacterales bacterium]|nr:short-chain dehydrogenase/reductase [Bryobacterales bacterium]
MQRERIAWERNQLEREQRQQPSHTAIIPVTRRLVLLETPRLVPVLSSRIPTLHSLTGKVVIVTGASEGIGSALATALQARGAKLVLVARSEERLRQRAGPDDLVISGDLTKHDLRERIVAQTVAHFGRFDDLINNAGRGSYLSAVESPLEEARSLFELNFFAPFHLTQLTATHVRRVQGTIVNVSSIAGQISLPWLPLYSASKFALASLTSTQRMELRRDGVHVMGVFPGYVDTGFQDHAAGGKPPASVVKGKKYSISAAACAEAIVRGMEERRATVVTPKIGWLPVLIARMWPEFFESRL